MGSSSDLPSYLNCPRVGVVSDWYDVWNGIYCLVNTVRAVKQTITAISVLGRASFSHFVRLTLSSPKATPGEHPVNSTAARRCRFGSYRRP